jgi:hypothetical protein
MNRTNITYGQLDKVLRSFGFAHRLDEAEPPADVYEHRTSGAVVSFPPFPKRDRVLDYHLVAVRTILDEYGIADPSTLANELQSVG